MHIDGKSKWSRNRYEKIKKWSLARCVARFSKAAPGRYMSEGKGVNGAERRGPAKVLGLGAANMKVSGPYPPTAGRGTGRKSGLAGAGAGREKGAALEKGSGAKVSSGHAAASGHRYACQHHI